VLTVALQAIDLAASRHTAIWSRPSRADPQPWAGWAIGPSRSA